jgi:peptide/nickel transport system permease protein
MTNVAEQLSTTSTKVVDQKVGGKRESNVVFWASASWLIVVVGFVLLGELNPLVKDPTLRDAANINAQPILTNLFKTDCLNAEAGESCVEIGGLMGNTGLGQDVFSQIVVGGRISIFVALMVTAIGIGVGGTMGLLAGYLKGKVDIVVQMIINTTLSVPALLLVIFIVTVRGKTLTNVILAVSLLAIPALARIVRASTLQVADREFVKAAEVLGVKKMSILFREVLPNVMPTLVSFAFLTTGIILVVESSLAFLGLSVPPPDITWGSIIANGRPKFQDAPHVVFAPAIILFLTVLALNLVGDRLLKRFDIREASL